MYELFMLWAMLNNQHVNTCYYLLDYLVFVAKKKPDEKSEIVVGGIIAFIEGNNRLDIDTPIAMNFIKPHLPTNMTYELKLNVPLCLFILPNPPRTDTRLEENLLYFGVNQVQEGHGNDGDDGEEEGEQLHDDLVHHEQEASEDGNDRWAWMQTKIQRISTEQQRQGAELSGLRGDVQRGNRMHEKNNQMLL